MSNKSIVACALFYALSTSPAEKLEYIEIVAPQEFSLSLPPLPIYTETQALIPLAQAHINFGGRQSLISLLLRHGAQVTTVSRTDNLARIETNKLLGIAFLKTFIGGYMPHHHEKSLVRKLCGHIFKNLADLLYAVCCNDEQVICSCNSVNTKDPELKGVLLLAAARSSVDSIRNLLASFVAHYPNEKSPSVAEFLALALLARRSENYRFFVRNTPGSRQGILNTFGEWSLLYRDGNLQEIPGLSNLISKFFRTYSSFLKLLSIPEAFTRKNREGQTILDMIIKSGNHEMLYFLLYYQRDINPDQLELIINTLNKYYDGYGIAYLAAQPQDEELPENIKALIKALIKVRLHNALINPFLLAASWGHHAFVREWITASGGTHGQLGLINRAFALAAYHRHALVMKVLCSSLERNTPLFNFYEKIIQWYNVLGYDFGLVQDFAFEEVMHANKPEKQKSLEIDYDMAIEEDSLDGGWEDCFQE